MSIGLSILSGSHGAAGREVLEASARGGPVHVRSLAGGIIPKRMRRRCGGHGRLPRVLYTPKEFAN